MDFLIPEVSIAEKIIRPAIVYLFLLIAFRLAGKRELGQMTPFDLIVLLTISNILQNAMIGKDDSLGGGVIGALTLFVLNSAISRLIFRFPRFAHFLEGEPTTLIQDGVIVEPNLRREAMRIDELQRALREHGLEWAEVARVERALLELDGKVTVQIKGATH